MATLAFYTIGNMTLPASWIAAVVAFISASSVVRLRYGKSSAHLFVDLLFYFVIIWKASVLVTDFRSVLHNPLALVYFNGGFVGLCLGIVAIFALIEYRRRKKRLRYVDKLALVEGFIIIQVVFACMLVLLTKETMAIQAVTITVFTLFMVTFLLFFKKRVLSTVQWVLLFMTVHVLVIVFSTDHILEAVSLFVTIVVGLWFVVWLDRNMKREDYV